MKQPNQEEKQQQRNALLKQTRNLLLKKSLQVCQVLIFKTTEFSFAVFKKIITTPAVEKQLDKQYNKFYFSLLKEHYDIELGSMLLCNKDIIFETDTKEDDNFPSNRRIILKKGEIFLLNKAFIKTPYKLELNEIEDFIDNGQVFDGWVSVIYKDIKFNTNARFLYDKVEECEIKKLV